MSDTLQETQRLFREARDALNTQRRQIEEDLRFSDPSDPQQWDDDVKRLRENDPGGRRPCLVMDQTGQYVANVAGQIEQRPPALHAIPVGGAADKQAAEQIDGRFRHIEHVSRADQHYARALTSAARVGVGYLTIRPEFVDRALGYQEPRIGSPGDPLSVVFDPWSVETDGADAKFGYELQPVSKREFTRRWPGKEAISFADESYRQVDDREQVLLVEEWSIEDQDRNMIVHVDHEGNDVALSEDEFWQAHSAGRIPPQPVPPRTYKDSASVVNWRRMSGAAVLEESVYPASSIGIVPVYGYVGFANGRMTYCGIPRRARAPQQAYNYHASEALAFIGTAPKAPYLVAADAVAGYENLWDMASVQSRAWLPYQHKDIDGGLIPVPQRINAGANLVNHESGAQQALRDIQASIGMYQANLGAPSNETSGVAIDSRKQQGESSTAHFPSHMAASLGQVGRIVMEMDARLTDQPRQQPIIGLDGSPGSVKVDPRQAESFKRDENGVSINPKVGSYGVRVVVGASYATQRQQTNQAFADIMRGNPELAPTVAPFWAQTLDFPGSDKFAQALAAMAPPPVKAILQPEGGGKDQPDPAAMAQQIAQLQQALQQATQIAHEAQADADQAVASEAEAKQLAAVRERELDIEAYNAETNRLKVTGANEAQVQQIVGELVAAMNAQPEPQPGDALEAPVSASAGPQPGPHAAASPQPEAQSPSSLGLSPSMPDGGALPPNSGGPDSQPPAPTAPMP